MSFSMRQYLGQTKISSIGANILTEMEYWLPLVADLTQRKVLFFVPTKDGKNVIITAKADPANGERIFFGEVGDAFPLRHENIISYVLKTGKRVYGTREVDIGAILSFHVFPLYDNAGLTIAAVGLLGEEEESANWLTDCAWRLLSLPRPELTELNLNVTPQDGILLFNATTGRIVYASEVGQHFLRWLDAEKETGRFRLDEISSVPPAARVRTSRTVVAEEWECAGRIMYGRAFPINEGGNVTQILLLLTDVTLLREKERELFVKDVVIQEIHHRVKNNLQTVASLLRMQARRSESKTKSALQQAERRIRAIAAIHDILAKQVEDRVDLSVLVAELVGQISHEWAPEVHITCEVDTVIGAVSSDKAVSIGMILHELVQNACEHGWRKDSGKEVKVKLLNTGTTLELRVSNDGMEIPAGFSEDSYHLGLQIVENLAVRNLGGSFKMYNERNAVVALCRFPIEEVEDE